MRHREMAICLRAFDYSETSQVVRLLTRGEGVVALMAKGAKRAKSKTGGALDILAEGELVYSEGKGDSLGTLMEFRESVSRATLRLGAERLYGALYAAELVGMMLAEGDPHPEVFVLLQGTLARLAEPDAPIPAVLAWFQWRLLRFVGLLGGLDCCCECGVSVGEMGLQAGVYFSSRQGGLLCEGCECDAPERFRIETVTLGGLAALAAVEAGQRDRRINLSENQARAVNRLLSYHVVQQTGKGSRMARHALGPGLRVS